MNLQEILRADKSRLLNSWKNRILEAYPSESVNFFDRQKNRFSNPVGVGIAESIERIFDFLSGAAGKEEADSAVENITRIRSVQDFKPSEATDFLFLLKRIIKDHISDRLNNVLILEQFFDLQYQIDSLCMQCFNHYDSCKEQLYKVQAEQVKRYYFRLLERHPYFVQPEQENADQNKEK